MADYTDIVARFTDDVAARALAEFIASLGVSCDVVETWNPQHIEQFAIRVPRSRISDMRRALDLKPVATRLSSFAAQIVAGRLAREGVPCYVGGLNMPGARGGDSDVPIKETTEGHAGVDCMIAVPAQFVTDALRILNVAPVSDDELTKLALADDPRAKGPP